MMVVVNVMGFTFDEGTPVVIEPTIIVSDVFAIITVLDVVAYRRSYRYCVASMVLSIVVLVVIKIFAFGEFPIATAFYVIVKTIDSV